MIPFIGLNDLSDALGGEDVSTSDLAVIALDSACQQVRDEIANVVNLTEDEEVTLDGNGRHRLILPQPPVRDVASVEVDGVTLEISDYVLEAQVPPGQNLRAFLRRVGGTWPIGLGNVVVTYTHGWDISEPASDPPPEFERVPSSIREVALELASRIYRQYKSGSVGSGAVTALKLGSAAISYDVGTAVDAASLELTTAERKTLTRYKTFAFA